MAIHAVGLFGVLSCGTNTAEDVRLDLHHLDVTGAHAPGVSAQVVGMENLTARQRDTVG